MTESMIERDVRTFKAVINGGTLESVATSENINKSRVFQVFNRTRRRLIHPKILGENILDMSNTRINDLRENCNFWLSQADKFLARSK